MNKVIAEAVANANVSQGLSEAAMVEFRAYAEAALWDKAEDARNRVVAHGEAYMDHLMVAFREMAKFNAKR